MPGVGRINPARVHADRAAAFTRLAGPGESAVAVPQPPHASTATGDNEAPARRGTSPGDGPIGQVRA
jgi:hypothetical protein